MILFSVTITVNYSILTEKDRDLAGEIGETSATILISGEFSAYCWLQQAHPNRLAAHILQLGPAVLFFYVHPLFTMAVGANRMKSNYYMLVSLN